MDRIKDDKYYLEKVVKDIKYLLRVTKDVSKIELEENETLLDSVMFRFIQISENIKRLTEKLKNDNPHIPWVLVIGLRNRIVHEYGTVDITVIYDVLKENLNKLYKDLKELIL
ncbi:MAG: DUF86 domain-containing protein [Acholeplasmatales bacterium]|jgi:uncharacterized protein with HEPN domain|nr:DUF86 domain-containing protein [Acholeplasmataceae bacterium]MCK9289850.1 DUF86 domain-containing protein [Acholeplasmataceae bacterium]MCK9428344.1 DUF86 domain-containing protein [Acholeplasmataceae bacterium]MDY0115922.1 DUF86 domain-containing protein [Acholeplasmatales bacterium]